MKGYITDNSFTSYATIGSLTYYVCGTYERNKTLTIAYTSINLLGSHVELVSSIPEDILGAIDMKIRDKLGEEE